MKYILTILLGGLLNFTILAQSAVVPIVQTEMLIGGVQNGKWLTAKQTAQLINDENEFILINPKGTKADKRVKGKKGEDMGACPENPVIRLDLETKPDQWLPYSLALGSNLKWNPLPRIPKTISPTDKIYQKIVADFLKTRRITKTKIKISQAFRVDLEGDGTEEIIIAANYYKRGMVETQSIGDYSFVLLRKIVQGKPQNILIDGEFFTKTDDYSPPNMRDISPIADLNGDGKMEIVLDVHYYEGNWGQVYELQKNKLTRVLDVECGL
jgi:hypothetical protein